MEAIKQLKAKIKGLAAEGRRIRLEEIRPSKGLDRNAAWERKRAVGREARHALVAYAYLRGRSYAKTEPNSEDIFCYAASKVLMSVGVEVTTEQIAAWAAQSLSGKEAA